MNRPRNRASTKTAAKGKPGNDKCPRCGDYGAFSRPNGHVDYCTCAVGQRARLAAEQQATPQARR